LIAEDFTDLLVSYATTGNLEKSKAYSSAKEFRRRSLGSGNREFAGMIRESMELFVMGHEYAHVAQRNAAASGSESLLWDVRDATDRENPVMRSHLKEIDADTYGVWIAAMITMSNRDTSLAYMGADAYFSGADMMGRALSVLRQGRADDMNTATHPSPRCRRELLRRSFSKFPASEQAKADAIDDARKLELIAELLWGHAYRTLKDLHRRGTLPAPWWQS
jgi:hypothetical protein